MAKITLGKNTYTVSRAKFKLWIELGEIQEKILSAVDAQDTDGIGDGIVLYVSKALGIDASEISDLPWKETASAYSLLLSENLNIKQLPFMKHHRKSQEDEKEVYDYPGRLWYSYAHRIMREYGWKLSDISELDVDDALALVQEILISEQLNKEWEWMLSEKSSGYDEAAKRAKFIELPRPDWMKPIPKPPKQVRIPRYMMPKGNVMKITANGKIENVTY